jgi:hypothetical protein
MVLLNVITSDHPGLGFFLITALNSSERTDKATTGSHRSGVWLYLAE